MDPPGHSPLLARDVASLLGRADVVRGDGLTGLDFDGLQRGTVLDQQIGLETIVVAPEVNVGGEVEVASGLDDLGNDQLTALALTAAVRCPKA